MTKDVKALSEFFGMFKALGLYQDMDISPAHPTLAIKIDEHINVDNPRKIFNKLPTLFKGYMLMGLKVCGRPVQGDFGTAVFPVLLNLKNTNQSYKKHFLGNNAQNLSSPKTQKITENAII
jgi:hypothetical protein